MKKFDRVTAALHNANLTDKYQSIFIEQEVTDDAVLGCLQNREDVILLSEVIPVIGHRMIFISKFRETGTVQQQQQQWKRPRTSRSPEIVVLDEDEVSDSLSISSSTTTTTTTQVKIEPSSSSSSSSFSTQNPSTTTTTTDFTSVLKNASDESIKLYTRKMSELLSAPGFFMDESALIEKHEENRSNAIEYFSSSYLEYKKSMSQVNIKSEDGEIVEFAVKMENGNEEIFNLKKSDLHDEIQNKFEEYKGKNELNRSYYISKARDFVREAEKLYTSKMDKFIESCSNQDELEKKEKQVNAEVMQNFNSNIQNPQAKSEFIDELNEDLKESINKWFKDHLELFQLRSQEADVFLLKVKSFYTEEMENETGSENYIEPDELVKIGKKISDAALKMCKEKNRNPNLNVELTEEQQKRLEDVMNVIYKKYERKNLLKQPASSPAIGIDLGTSYSSVAVVKNGKVEVIYNEFRDKKTPSFVSFQNSDGSVVVGALAKDQSYRNSQTTIIFDAKRLIGRDFEDETVKKYIKIWPFNVINEYGKPLIKIRRDLPPPPPKRPSPPRARKTIGGRARPTPPKWYKSENQDDSGSFANYHGEEISALVLQTMKKIAEDYLGVEVEDAVISVPALFNDYQRQATRDAGEIAGLNVLGIINEPTAAAISYNLNRIDELKRNILVFDLGGGSLDVVIFEIVKGEIIEKSAHGDIDLGGQNFDTEMVEFCIASFKTEHGIDLARSRESKIAKHRFNASARLRRIRDECEKQKQVLSSNIKTVVEIGEVESKPKLLNLRVPFTRETFESLNQKHFDRCLEIVQLALDEAKMNKSEIDEIVLVGGSTRIPKIQTMLSDFFDGKTLCKSINPDHAVAEGAAIQACILSGQGVKGVEEIILENHSQYSINIQDDDHYHIEKMSNNYSYSYKVDWTTSRDDQTQVQFKIYEGEHENPKDNTFKGEFVLDGIPPNKAGEEKLRVKIRIDEHGLLHVKSQCLSSGTSSELTTRLFKNRMTRMEIDDLVIW